MLNYKSWRIEINQVNDQELKDYLLGFLAKYYLYSSRILMYHGWEDEIVSYKEAKKYALNRKERVKAIIYNYFPNIYVKIGNSIKEE